MARLELRDFGFRHDAEEPWLFRKLSYRFPEAGTVIVCGPNGVGKSTLLACLSGALPPSEGEVLVEGKATGTYGSEEDLEEVVTFIFQNMEFESDEPVGTLVGRVAERGAERPDRPDPGTLLAAFELEGISGKSIARISKGELQKVILVFALVSAPRILVLDEPVFALSREDANAALDLVSGYAKKLGMLLIFSLHDLAMAERYGETALLLGRDGTFTAGPAGTVLTRENYERAYGVPYALLHAPQSLAAALHGKTAPGKP